VLQVEDLYLELDGKPIINGLNLHVKRGEIHGVLGENGTGKTSLAYVIMGVNNYKATSGKILFEGQDIDEMSVSERAQHGISLAWQEPARIEGLTVRDYLSLSSRNAGFKRIYECLEAVGMDPGRYIARDIDGTLSGGERKRIELASIIAMQPKLAILDEPDSGIDIVSLPILLYCLITNPFEWYAGVKETGFLDINDYPQRRNGRNSRQSVSAVCRIDTQDRTPCGNERMVQGKLSELRAYKRTRYVRRP